MDMPYSGNKLHPTQTPIPALVSLIRSFSLQGETILDPFAGSGSTCAAALLSGRRYIGIEMDDAYRQLAIERYNVFTEEPLLSGSHPFSRQLHPLPHIADAQTMSFYPECVFTLQINALRISFFSTEPCLHRPSSEYKLLSFEPKMVASSELHGLCFPYQIRINFTGVIRSHD